ncbi:hypothetical protein PHLCEN_2v12890 [Hermanssonia centrifuga]|uniref:Uncharacterized protein n=1 Tax=Hermanssonia centrifuga TaxID=98765 RepID=A0A2R6NFW1_9APHY|nr:hypothetical protein PHLCEN_2v12890 [Hermanssonia centrifuga]
MGIPTHAPLRGETQGSPIGRSPQGIPLTGVRSAPREAEIEPIDRVATNNEVSGDE